MALTPTELQEAENEAKELWAEVQNGTLPLEEVEPIVRDAVTDGDYTEAVGNEIIRQVNVLAVAAGQAPAPPSSPTPTPQPPPPVAAPKPKPPPQPAAPPLSKATTALSAADDATAKDEARELWAEVNKGLVPLDEVQDIINDAVTDGDYSQAVGDAVVRFVHEFHRANEANKQATPSPPPAAAAASSQPPPPASAPKPPQPPPPPGPPPPKKEAKKGFSLFGSKKPPKGTMSSSSAVEEAEVETFGMTPESTPKASPRHSPEASPQPMPTAAAALPPPIEGNGGGGEVDTMRARNEARDIWEEVKANEMTLDEVQDFVDANVKDGDYFQATANDIVRLVLVAAAAAGMTPPPPPKPQPLPPSQPPPPANPPAPKGNSGPGDTKRSIKEASALWATLSKDKVPANKMEALVADSVAESVANGDYNQATGDLIQQLLRDKGRGAKPPPPTVAPPPTEATDKAKASHYFEAVKAGTIKIAAVKDAVDGAVTAGDYSRSHGDMVVAKLDELLALCAEPFATAICELAKKGKIKKTKAAVDAAVLKAVSSKTYSVDIGKLVCERAKTLVEALPQRRGTLSGLFGGGNRGKSPPRNENTPPPSSDTATSAKLLLPEQQPPPPTQQQALASSAEKKNEEMDLDGEIDFAGDSSDDDKSKSKPAPKAGKGEVQDESEATKPSAATDAIALGLTPEEAQMAQSEAKELWEEIQGGAVPLDNIGEIIDDAVNDGDYSRAVGDAILRYIKSFAASTKPPQQAADAKAAEATDNSSSSSSDASLPPLPYNGSMNDAVKAQDKAAVQRITEHKKAVAAAKAAGIPPPNPTMIPGPMPTTQDAGKAPIASSAKADDKASSNASTGKGKGGKGSGRGRGGDSSSGRGSGGRGSGSAAASSSSSSQDGEGEEEPKSTSDTPPSPPTTSTPPPATTTMSPDGLSPEDLALAEEESTDLAEERFKGTMSDEDLAAVVNDAVDEGDYSRAQADAILRLAREKYDAKIAGPLDDSKVEAAAEELLTELRKEGLPVDDVNGLVDEAVDDGDYSRAFGDAVVKIVRERYVAPQAPSSDGASTPASALPYEGDLKAAMAAADRPAIKQILAHRDAAKLAADEKKGEGGGDEDDEMKQENDDSSSSSSSESDNEDEKMDELPPLPGFPKPESNGSNSLPPLPPLPSEMEPTTTKSPPSHDPLVEEEANVIWAEITDGNLPLDELPEIVQEAVADGDYSEGQGKAIVERVRALSKESAGVTSTHDNASNSDAIFAADSAAPASTTADSGKKRFSIFGGGKKTPPPPPPPPPPKSELGLSVQDLEAKFKAAAGSDEVLNKAEFNALVLSLMKGASQRPSERDLDAAFEISDADKSGTVDMFEFIRLYELVKQGTVVGLGKGGGPTSSLHLFGSGAHALKEAKFKEALKAAKNAAFSAGDEVTWKGADAELPEGTVGKVLFLHGDGDVECLFPTSTGESNTFTFAADRLELKVRKSPKTAGSNGSSSSGAAGSVPSEAPEPPPVGAITSDVLEDFLKEYIEQLATEEVDAVSSEEEKQKAAEEKKARKEAEKAAKKAAKAAEKAAKKAKKAQEREEAIQKEADYEALQAINKKREEALGALAPLESEPSKYAPAARKKAPTPRRPFKDQPEYDDVDHLKAESEARVQKAREFAAEKRAAAKAEREQREKERAERKAAAREKKRLEDEKNAEANAETEAQARAWAEADARRVAQEKEAQREKKRAANAKRKEAETAAKAAAEAEEAQRRAQQQEEDAAFKLARAEEVAAYEQRRKARAKKAKQEAAARAAEEAEALARKQNELAKLRRPNRLKKGSSVNPSQFQRESEGYGDGEDASDERGEEDDQVGALPPSSKDEPQTPSSEIRQGFWGRAFSGRVDVLGARRNNSAITVQTSPSSARAPPKWPLPKHGKLVAPDARSYGDLMEVQGQRQTFAEHMASKKAIESAGDEKREDVLRNGELFTRAEFVQRYGDRDGASKWSEAAQERRVDAADGCGYTREEFIEEYGNLDKWQKSSRAAPTRLTAGFVVNGRLLSTAGTGDTQKEQRNSKLAARQDAVKASRVAAAEERAAVEERRRTKAEQAELRAAADAAAAAIVAAATKTAFIKAGRETALGKRLELERRANEHTAQELERSSQYTRSLGKRDLIDPLRLGKDGCFAAALATAVAASVAAESAAQAAQEAVDSRKDLDPAASSSRSSTKQSRKHAAHAQAHAAAATMASGAATLAAAQAVQLAPKAGPRVVAAAAAKALPSASPIRSSRTATSPPSSGGLLASPVKKSDASQSAMASPLFGGNGDDEEELLDDFDGGDYVAKWQVQR